MAQAEASCSPLAELPRVVQMEGTVFQCRSGVHDAESLWCPIRKVHNDKESTWKVLSKFWEKSDWIITWTGTYAEFFEGGGVAFASRINFDLRTAKKQQGNLFQICKTRKKLLIWIVCKDFDHQVASGAFPPLIWSQSYFVRDRRLAIFGPWHSNSDLFLPFDRLFQNVRKPLCLFHKTHFLTRLQLILTYFEFKKGGWSDPPRYTLPSRPWFLLISKLKPSLSGNLSSIPLSLF